MFYLTEAGRLSIICLLRQIIQQNPPIQVLNMNRFSKHKDREENIGELVFETLLNANIETITDLDLSCNYSWFLNPVTREERSSNIDLLVELI